MPQVQCLCPATFKKKNKKTYKSDEVDTFWKFFLEGQNHELEPRQPKQLEEAEEAYQLE